MKKIVLIIYCILFLICISNAFPQSVSTLIVNEFMASNNATIKDGNGDYSDWVELYNPTASAISLAGCYMTDDEDALTKWAIPSTASVPASGYLVIFLSGKASGSTPYIDSLGYIHASFKLNADGESIALIASDGTTVISAYWDFPLQGTDVSYGLGSNAISGFMKTPTPGAANGVASENGFVEDTQFNVKRGFYNAPFDVTITTKTDGATIKYTTDCSSPSETNGTIYKDPITVSKTTVIRAMAYKSGWTSTDIDTQTYIFLSDIISQPATKPNSLWPDPYTPSGGGGASKQAIDYAMDTDVTNDSRYKDLMDDALLSVPSIAITTDLPNLFNSSTGIYANPTSDGEAWERPACVELIYPDGTEGFHVNTGLRIRGGVSSNKSNPKHSFRIIMRSEYGDSKIDFPMFGTNGAQTFDKMDFRTAQNFSWNNSSPQYATWLDDPFSRDLMRDMGHPYTRGFFFHLYLDGVYWGLYQTEERPDSHFGESYLGGNDDDYDVVKSDEDTGTMYATDGTTSMYFSFWTLVNAGVTTAAAYYKLQGKNADGSANASYPHYLDPENLIDYMLLVFYTGAQDMPLGPPNSNSKPRNLYAIANRANPDGFKYLPHDNEWSLLQQSGINVNRVTASLGSSLGTQSFFNPWWLHSKLKTNAEYLINFADRVHKHFFNGGALTPAACVTRFQTRIDEINLAIIAESARWGDYLSANDPRTKDDDWLPAVKWVKDSFLNASPQTRTVIVLAQLKSAGLYPSINAPEFNQFGGNVASGFNLIITTTSGTIYYTTDGTDPRQIGGAIASTASSGSSGLSIILNSSKTIKARAYSGSVWSAITDATFVVGDSPTPTPTPTFTATPTPTKTPTPTPAPTLPPTPSPTSTPTAIPTPTPTMTPIQTPTPTPTQTQTNQAPTIQINEPSQSETSSVKNFKIKFSSNDPDNDAAIALYYNTENNGIDGVVIASNISEDSGASEYDWDVSVVPQGIYWIYGTISDGINTQALAYSKGTVKVSKILKSDLVDAILGKKAVADAMKKYYDLNNDSIIDIGDLVTFLLLYKN